MAEASHFGPRELRRLGRALLEVVAPEIADEAAVVVVSGRDVAGVAR